MRKLVGRWNTILSAPGNLRPGAYRAKSKNLDILSNQRNPRAYHSRDDGVGSPEPAHPRAVSPFPVASMRLWPLRDDWRI